MAQGIEFEWDDENRKHLAAHNVTPAEFEYVLTNNAVDLGYELIDDEERYRAVGLTSAGRLLTVVWTPRNGSVRTRDRVPGDRFRQEGVSGGVSMKKQIKKQTKRIVPTFATEAEEAQWWYKNRNTHGKELLAAVKSGEAQVLTREKLLARLASSKKAPAPVVALRIPAADLALARKQAEQKGLPYQTYIKSLLHETLAEREKRKAG